MSAAESTTRRPGRMRQTLELARFRAKPQTEAALVETRRRAIDALRSECEGFVSGSFVRIGEDEWIDVIVWSDRERAEIAAAKFLTIPGCADHVEAVAELVSMEHGEIVDTD
jgi:hypothetical protein